uniref:Cell division protein n=1 Tax=Pediastrum angulosum TaxID=271408 RepID=A0A2U8GHR1_9CHLO|nr:cell division protein [Pediastrum angulosum]
MFIKSFQLNPGSFFPQKKNFMQYWIFPLIGFVGLTWNKNSNLFEIIDFKKSFLYSDRTNIHNILIRNSLVGDSVAHSLLRKKPKHRTEEEVRKNEKYNLNQIPEPVESSFTFNLQQEKTKKNQESYQNDLYEYYFIAKSALEQQLSDLNYYGNQPAKFLNQNSQLYVEQEKNYMLFNSFLWSKSVTNQIGNFFLNNKFNLKNQRNNILTIDLNFNFSHINTSQPLHFGSLGDSANQTESDRIVDSEDKEKGNFFINTNLTSNIREIYKKSPKKLLPISRIEFGIKDSENAEALYYKNLNNNNKKEGNNKSKSQRNKIKKNTLFSIIEIPNTFCIKPISQKQKEILHNHPIRSYEKAKILLDNAIKNSLLKETNNKDKNFKFLISIHSLDKLKNQSYFLNKNLTKSKLLFDFSVLKSSQQNKYLSESKIIKNLFFLSPLSQIDEAQHYASVISHSAIRSHNRLFRIGRADADRSTELKQSGGEESSLSSPIKSSFLKVQDNNKIKECTLAFSESLIPNSMRDIFVKKISEKLKFDLDKLLFSKRFKKNFILFNKINNQQNQKTNLKFLFLLHSNLKNTNNILKKFNKIKVHIPSIKENNMKNYIYELSVLNYWKKSLNLLNLNNNKIFYSSKFLKKEQSKGASSLSALSSSSAGKTKCLRINSASQTAEVKGSKSTASYLGIFDSQQSSIQKKPRSGSLRMVSHGLKDLDKKSGEEFFNKFAKIQKLLSRYSKNSSLLKFETSNLNPIKLKNSIITSDLFYKDNLNILSTERSLRRSTDFAKSNKFIYIAPSLVRSRVLRSVRSRSTESPTSEYKEQNLVYNSHLYSYNRNSKENYINKNFYRKNKKVLSLCAKFMYKSILRFGSADARKMNDFNKSSIVNEKLTEKFKNKKFKTSSESKIQKNKEQNYINFILHLKKIKFINLNNFYSKLYFLIDNLSKILSNDLTKKTTFIAPSSVWLAESPMSKCQKNFNNINIVKTNIQKRLIKKKNNFKLFGKTEKLDLNSKTFNKNFRKNKKEKIFRTLLSYKFSKENFKDIKFKKNNITFVETKKKKRIQTKLKKRMRRLLSISRLSASRFDSRSKRVDVKKPNNIQYKYYKKNTFRHSLHEGARKINSVAPRLNTSPLFSQSVIVNKTRFEKKEKHNKNNISLNRILRRIGFVFLSELKIKKNYSPNKNYKINVPNLFINENQTMHEEEQSKLDFKQSSFLGSLPFASSEPMRRSGSALPSEEDSQQDLNKKESLIQRFEKEKSLQKRHRRKKLKLETRRRKKRKRFYPRPVWLRYSLYKKFLNFRHSYNNLYYRKKVSRAFGFARGAKQRLFNIGSAKAIRLLQGSASNSRILKSSSLRCFGFAECATEPLRDPKALQFFNNKKLKNKIYRNNKQKWGNFIQDTPQFEQISLKKINFFHHFPVFQNKEYYKVSGRILAEFQPLCWKSYWLRSNLTPYMNRIENNFSFMKQVEKTNNISNINSFLYKIFGFFSYDFYSFKFKMLPFYTDFKNSFDNQHAFYLSNLFSQESTNKIAEYNRIEFERFSEILKNVKFNMNLEGQLKPKSYKFIAWKYLLSARELKTFNKKNFWYRLSYNMNPNLSSVSPFVILSNTFSKNFASIKPYGSSGTLRTLWTFNKTNIFTFKEKNQIRNLWEQTKLREQLKSNQTKKFLMNVIKVKDNLYLKDIFYKSFLSEEKNKMSTFNSLPFASAPPMRRSGSVLRLLAERRMRDQSEEANRKTKKSPNFKDFKNLNSINFSTIKKLQTAQKKLVLMSLFQQKSLASASRLAEPKRVFNNTNYLSYNYYIRLLKSKISNSPLHFTPYSLSSQSTMPSALILFGKAEAKEPMWLQSGGEEPKHQFGFAEEALTLKNKKDSPSINIAKPRLLKPSSYFWWSSKNFQMPFNLNMFNDSYRSLFFLSLNSKIPKEQLLRESESNIPSHQLRQSEAQQPKINKLIVYNILIFSILFHLSILFSFIRIPELRGLLKFQILLFYKISNSYFIILYSIYDLLKKYKTETFKTYNSLYQKTYKLFSYINILDLESQKAYSFGKSDYPSFHFGKETKKIIFSELKNQKIKKNQEKSNFSLWLAKPLHRSVKRSVLSIRFGGADAKKPMQYKNLKNKKYFAFLSSEALFGSFASSQPLLRISGAEAKGSERIKAIKDLSQPSISIKQWSFIGSQIERIGSRSEGKVDEQGAYAAINNQSALKYPKIYNKDLKSYNENNKKDLSSKNLNKSFTTYITSQTPFIYSFSYNIVEFLYTKKILNKILSAHSSALPLLCEPIDNVSIHSNSHTVDSSILSLSAVRSRVWLRQSTESKEHDKQAKKPKLHGRGKKSDLKILKLDIKKNSITELYKRFISFRNIQTNFALFFLYLSYGFVHLSIGLFESTYQFLLKIIDLFESFLLIIYKFLEKPAELMIEWIAQIFLIEWSSDPSSFIPETFDMYFWYSFQKFFRNTRILGFVEFQNSTNIYNIMNSLELNGFGMFDSWQSSSLVGSFASRTEDPKQLNDASMFSFSISNILGFFMQRRLWNFFHLFIDSMLKPDIDLIVRQKKGKIFWDIWADILIRAAEQYNINIPSLTSLKEEQEKLIERLIQDPAFINFSVLVPRQSLHSVISEFGSLASPMQRFDLLSLSSPLHQLVASALSSASPMHSAGESKQTQSKTEQKKTTYNFKNKNKISNILYNKNVFKNFYKTKSWSSNQYVTYNLKDTDLFLDISPPKSLLYVHFINGYEPIQYTLGSIMCEIYSGLFSHKVSKNLLIVNSHVSDLPLRSAISSNFFNSTKSSFDFQSTSLSAKQPRSGSERSYGSLIIQALAGESEMKMMIDNANRYASIQRGVAVGMKLLRDVFESIVLQTPCFFLMEDLHILGERRPMLISDDENSYALREKEFSIFGFEQDEESEKNQMIYQSSRHSINDFRRPYKGDFSMLIPTNLYNKNLYSFKTFLNNTKPTHQKKYPISLPSLHDTIENKMLDQSYDKNKQNNFSQSFNISRLQIASENFFAPPATSPFTILMMKEQRKLKPKKVVKQISWNSFVAENIALPQSGGEVSKNDSIRVKVAILADMTLRNFSYNKDMITDLLVIIDGVRSNRGFVVFATTHLPSILDPALRRPGRFDETISLPLLPNLMNRWSLFQMHFGSDLLFSASVGSFVSRIEPNHIDSVLRLLVERRTRDRTAEVDGRGLAKPKRKGTLQKKFALLGRAKAKETFDRFDYGILTENFNFTQISNLISKTKLSCNVNYNLAKSPIIHPSQVLQSFFIEKDYRSCSDLYENKEAKMLMVSNTASQTEEANKIMPFNSSRRGASNFSAKREIYSQISFVYFQIGNLLISSDFLKDQTYFSLYNKSLILEQSSPFVFHTLYSSLNTFKMFIMRLLGGKIAEFLVSKNQRNLYDSFNSINSLASAESMQRQSRSEQNKNLIISSQTRLRSLTEPKKGSEDKFNLSHSSFMKGSGKVQKLNFSIMDHMIRYKSWHFATSLIFSILQKRFLYNKNLIITKMLSFDNPNQSSLREPPSPPASSLLMPSKKYENFKRIERDFQQKSSFSIYEKMQMHQKQRFLKKLYNKPVLESFKSQLSASVEPMRENRLTSFESSFKEFSYNKDSNLLKLSSSHSYYKNRLNIRHRFSLINQWWNGQLAEHNVEITYLSDIDWRTMYVQAFASAMPSEAEEPNNKSSYEKLGLSESKIPNPRKQSKSILAYSKTSNKTDSMLDFPDAEQYYNPRIRRWFLNANSWNYWLNFENTFYYEIYSHMIYDSFNKTSLYFNQNRELLDFFVYTYNIKGSLKEIDLIFILSRFYRK